MSLNVEKKYQKKEEKEKERCVLINDDIERQKKTHHDGFILNYALKSFTNLLDNLLHYDLILRRKNITIKYWQK